MSKLELNWIGKHDPENKINPEPRILIEKPEYNYGDGNNALIHGDNLLALKSLQSEYAGKVAAIVIDPPYNTQSCFAQYDDNLEHSTWLNLMRPRLELLRSLLSDKGSIWISIDDDERDYLKVLCDEVFGRSNFVRSVVWEKKYSPQANAQWLSDSHDYVLIYAKKKDLWSPNLLPRTDEMDKRYKNPDNDPRGVWKAVDATIGLTGGQRGAQYAKTGVSPNLYELTTPSGRKLWPTKGRCWYYTEDKMLEAIKDNRVWFGKNGDNVPAMKRFLTEVKDGIVAKTLWFRGEVGDNQEAKKEALSFNSDDVFATPKPERLIERILTLATNPGDLVLDSFLGSGTTAAVAHKMGRRWIGIELGDHAYTHCYPRLKAVVDGEQGGISKAVNWQGGGGFKFYELAPTLLESSEYGNLVISDKYNKEMLAQAMAKHEGYTYEPNENCFWKQGYSGDSNYIFTTTGHISPEYLDNIASQLQKGEYLLICAKSFDTGCLNRHENVLVRHIPRMLLGRCEWGKDNYDLNIIMQDSDDWGEDDDE